MIATNGASGVANESPGLKPVPAPRADVGLPADLRLAAMAAGARARGMADSFDMLGIAAVLFDGEATALHVNRQAAALMGAHLGICARQLIASTLEENARLQRALDAALCGAAVGTVAIARGGQPDLMLHILPVPGQDEACQLLKAVVVINDVAGAGAETTLFSRLLRDGAPLH